MEVTTNQDNENNNMNNNSKEEEHVCPILYFTNEFIDTIEKNNIVDSVAEACDAKIKFYKIDKNKNLLLFPATKEDATKLNRFEGLFNGCQKKDLEKSEINKTRAVILKAITFEETQDVKKDLYELGVVDCEDMSKSNKANLNKRQTIVNIVKGICRDNSTRNKLLRRRKIAVKGRLVEIEPYIRNPIQCIKCKNYGHIVKNCTNKSACAFCGSSDENHEEENCASIKTPKCINCSDSHPAFSKRCRVYLNLKKKLINETYDELDRDQDESNNDTDSVFSSRASTSSSRINGSSFSLSNRSADSKTTQSEDQLNKVNEQLAIINKRLDDNASSHKKLNEDIGNSIKEAITSSMKIFNSSIEQKISANIKENTNDIFSIIINLETKLHKNLKKEAIRSKLAEAIQEHWDNKSTIEEGEGEEEQNDTIIENPTLTFPKQSNKSLNHIQTPVTEMYSCLKPQNDSNKRKTTCSPNKV